MPRPLEHIPDEEFVLRAKSFVLHLQQRRNYLEHICCRVNAGHPRVSVQLNMHFLFFPAHFLATACFITGNLATVGASEIHFQVMAQARTALSCFNWMEET